MTAGKCTCVWILDCWHARHFLVHWLTCFFFSPCQTNFCDTNVTVDFRLECAKIMYNVEHLALETMGNQWSRDSCEYIAQQSCVVDLERNDLQIRDCCGESLYICILCLGICHSNIVYAQGDIAECNAGQTVCDHIRLSRNMPDVA